MQDGERWLRFARPERVLEARSPGEVKPLLDEIEAETARGRYATGFLAYEASSAFDLAAVPAVPGLPLAWFGIYAAAEPACPPPVPSSPPAIEWTPALAAVDHRAAVVRLQERIAAGDTYQVNLTFPLRARFSGDAFDLFGGLCHAQRASHAAYLDTGRFAICSASPELFFRREGDLLTARPMKGTAPRGRTGEEDALRAEALRASAKDRAENLMIVDMLRNDLGRVAAAGSVEVPDLFRIERYPTVLQMTSTVTARTTAAFPAIVEALFPCASITGAPKVATMRLIAEAEAAPRGVYTGAIGYVAPERQACFSVAIRTAVVDRESGEATYGVGSGIVADSVAEAEYAECLLKAKVLDETPFRLLETMLCTPGEGLFLEDLHLRRLLASAAHFGGRADRVAIEKTLRERTGPLSKPARVRLLVDLDGGVEVQTAPLPAPSDEPLRVGLAPEPIDETSPWLFHKTTHRELYERAAASRPDLDEVILWNRRGEATEGTKHNLVVDLGDGLVTPPVACGLLPGTYRARLLEKGRVREAVVPMAELARAKALFLVNSVAGWRKAVLVQDPDR